MALRLRLARRGAKKRPFYHIVVAEHTSPRDGRFIEKLGYFNPMVAKDHPERIILNNDRIKHWLGTGALPSDRVARFLGEAGLMAKFVYTETPKKSAPKAKALERIQEKEEKAKAALEAKKEAEEAAKAEAAAAKEAAKAEAEAAKEAAAAAKEAAKSAPVAEEAPAAPAEEAPAEEAAADTPAAEEEQK